MHDCRYCAGPKKHRLRTRKLILQIVAQVSCLLTARKAARPAPALGIVLALCLSSGCSSPAQSPEPAANGGTGPARDVIVNPIPFSELLRSLPKYSTDETRAYVLAVLSSASESEASKQEAAYMLARILQKAGSPDELRESMKLFEQASRQAPLWERCQWHISECANLLGQEESVRQALESIGKRSESASSKAAAEYGLAQSYSRGNEPERAKKAFMKLRKLFPASQYALGAAYYLGEAEADDREQQAQAIELFREYLKASPDGHFARDVVTRLTALPEFKATETDRDIFAKVHYLHGEWEQALAHWSQTRSDQHWYEQATCLRMLGRATEARDAYESGINGHPNDPSLPEAARLLCTYLTRDQAAAVWQGILARSTRFGDLALWNLALRSSPPVALSYYNRIVSAHPRSAYAPEASWWLFWNQVKEGKSAAAISRAESALKLYGASRAGPRFAFWAGKLHERLKQKEAARAAYKHAAERYAANYYGHRARARLAALSGGRDRGWSTRPARRHPVPNWSWPAPPQMMSWPEVATTYGSTQEILARLGQWDECLQLLPEKSDPLLRSWLTASLDLPLDAINLMTGHLQGVPRRTVRWEMAYPLLYSQEVSREAAARKVDPLLAHALIREESRYNARALSRSHALGLMQLLPGTAYGVAKRLKIALSGTDQVFDPATNIALGTAYLASTLERSQGQAMLAVAGYNGGPNAARSWNSRFQSAGGGDYDIFVEDIPYRETRDYVRKVFGSYWNYEAIYGAPKS